MTIERHSNGYTVYFCGDEFYFDTEEQAKAFIKEVEE